MGSEMCIRDRLRFFTGGDQGVFNCPSRDERCRWNKGAPPGYTGPRAEARHTGFGYEVGEPLLRWSAPGGDDGTYFSYGYNRLGVHASGAYKLGLGYLVVVGVEVPLLPHLGELHVSRVRAPTEMIAIADSAPSRGMYAFTIQPESTAADLNPGRIHGGGANVLFCDGHVQWYLQRDFVLTVPGTPEYERVARMWNNTNTPYPGE